MARTCAWIVLAIAAAVVAGWYFDFHMLRSFLPGRIEMKLVTAMTFTLAATALLAGLARPPRERIRVILAILVMVPSLVWFAEFVTKEDLLFWMWDAKETAAAETLQPGRMAPYTAVSFFFIGLTLLLLRARSRLSRLIVNVGLFVVSLRVLEVLMGYAYQARDFLGPSAFNPMPFPTAICLGFMVVGIASLRSHEWPLSLLRGEYPSAPLARMLLTGAVAIPFAIGWLRLTGERANMYDLAHGVAYFVLAQIVLVGSLILWSTSRLRAAEEAQADFDRARRTMTAQLEQANRVSGLGRVAATIAHEFNNVLMGIQPFAEVIGRKSGGDEKIRRAAEQILGSITRGKRVTQGILRFTQPDEPDMHPIVLCDWLRQLEPEILALIGPHVELVTELPDQTLVILGDSAQLQQVLTNLVLNAREAMSGRGRMHIYVETGKAAVPASPAGTLAIIVRDNGSGMTSEVLEQIFEPMFTTKRSGTGLGLAIGQQIISRHGGELTVESTVGEGSLFRIRLPRSNAAPAIPEREPTPGLSIQRILLVEDDAAVAGGIRALLESEGLAVRVVDEGGKAVLAVEEFSPDAVLLDVSLPDMSGVEVFSQLKLRWPALPIVFSTGHADESALEEQLSQPNVAFLRKPYDLDRLLATLHTVTSTAGSGVA